MVRSRTTKQTFVIYQSDFVSGLSTRLVIPIIKVSDYKSPTMLRLNPTVSIDDDDFVLRTDLCFTAMASDLQSTGHSVESERDHIRDAFDFLTTGF